MAKKPKYKPLPMFNYQYYTPQEKSQLQKQEQEKAKIEQTKIAKQKEEANKGWLDKGLDLVKSGSSFLKRKYDNATNAIGEANYKAGIRPRQETTYEQDRKEQRDARERIASSLPNFLQPTMRKVNKTLDNAEKSKVGKWMGRTGERGVATAMFDPKAVKTSTGSKVGDASADIIGNILGLVAPTGGANTALTIGRNATTQGLSKLAPNAGKIAKTVIGGAGAGASYGTTGGIVEGQKPIDIAKRAGKEAALFALLDYGATKGIAKSAGIGAAAFGGQSAFAGDKPKDIVVNALTGAGMGAIGGLGHSGKVRENLSQGKFEKIDSKQFFEDVNNAYGTKQRKLIPPVKEIGVKPSQGKYAVKNIELEKAHNEYNNAIETIQNRFGTNQLRANEEALIKSELGIDLEKLVSNIEKAEQFNPAAQLAKVGERNRFAQVAGLQEKPLLKFEPFKSPVAEQKALPNINPLATTNKALNETNPLLTLKENVIPLKPRTVNASSENVINLNANEGINPHEVNLENSADWKNKSKLSMKRETMKRIFEDTMGEDAPKMVEEYINPIETSEAERVRWLNKERSEISSLGIKGRSKESALVQKYGEGGYTESVKNADGKDEFIEQKYTLEDLKRDAPNNWQQIKHASEIVKGKYESYIDQVNSILTEAGFDPIKKRKDYFAHFQEVNDLFEKVGIPSKDNLLPTDINGITDDFRPNKNFFAHSLERKGNVTTLDAIQGIDRYLEGASRLIHHTGNIKRLRELDKALRNKYAGSDHMSNLAAELTEYTNILAGKKTRIDRAAEDMVGRKIFGIADVLRNQSGANMIGGNIASSLTSFIPLTQSLATTGKVPFIKAMFQTLGNIAKNDNFVDKSDFLTRRMGSDRLVKTGWENARDKGFWLFKVIDNFTSQIVTRSKYNEGIEKGLSPEEAMKRADDWSGRLMADRSVGSVPTLFEAKTLKLFTQFQLEVNNQLSFITKDIPRNYDKAAAASAIGQLVLYSWLFNNLYEKAVGRRPAFDPIGVIQKTYEDYTNPNKKITDANKNLIKNVSEQFPFVGMLTGGRIPIGGAIPNPIAVAKGESQWDKELEKALYGLILPTGGMQLKKTLGGLDALSKGGVYQKDKLMYPVNNDTKTGVKETLFGINSLPETNEYWDNNRRPLSEKQTGRYEELKSKGIAPKEVYNLFLELREDNKRKEQLYDSAKTTKLTQNETEEYQKLKKRVKELDLLLNPKKKK